MDRWAADALIELAAGQGGVPVRRALREDLELAVREIAGPRPTPAERMLAQTAALSWFALRRQEASNATLCAQGRGLDLAQSDFQQRKIDRAHRRLLSALKALAAVRRLAVPAVQVNVGPNQVNLAGG